MHIRRTLFVAAIPAILLISVVLASCQKELSFSDTSRGGSVDSLHIVDSTLLIKTIVAFSFDGQDSSTESYSYDTVNREITLQEYDPGSSDLENGIKATFSYNADEQLIHARLLYPPGYISQPSDASTIDVKYDAQKVLQTITINLNDGTAKPKDYVKNALTNGSYQLTWDESDPSLAGSRITRRAIFSANGNNTGNVVEGKSVSSVTPAGDSIFQVIVEADTLFYDNSGNLNKIKRTRIDSLNHTSETYVSYNFIRQTRGDQLYNQRQMLLKGIANMPFFDYDTDNSLFGMLSSSLENEEWQYSKYPLLSADMRWLNNDYHFSDSPEFDSLGRLIKFKGFQLDLGMKEGVIKIKYYK